MDIKPDIIKEEPEFVFVDFTESIVNIKSENEYNVTMDDIKTERDVDIENPINETSGTTIKQELDDEMWKIDVKKEVPEVKEEPSSHDDVEEKLPAIKTEEVMLKNESEEDDSETGAHWDSHMSDNTMSKVHERLTKRYGCDHCDYRTNCSDRLRNHIIIKHAKNSIKTYCCNHCDFKTDLKAHLRLHTELHDKNLIQKYECHLCEYKTIRNDYLKKHIVAHHDKNSVKRYGCHICHYRTYRSDRLEKHITKHNKNLNKKYGCDHCHYRTNQKNNLKRHMTRHDRHLVNKYCCHLCDYKIDVEINLKNHLLTEHNIVGYMQQKNVVGMPPAMEAVTDAV